ncbi:hypothetical protein TIFTF001_033672 [Ficus carica]|uniref:Uncharacterized protein n=1 Tax=Ficus carica TaxID=3494 RepID=A0AA88DZ78_FICCA|nr:hypothetical protein TIFTF001_033672 [Ficus carica]
MYLNLESESLELNEEADFVSAGIKYYGRGGMKLRNMFVEFDHEHVLHIVVAHTFQEKKISGIKGF